MTLSMDKILLQSYANQAILAAVCTKNMQHFDKNQGFPMIFRRPD